MVCNDLYSVSGKEKLAEHLKMSGDQAKAIMASFLGKFTSIFIYSFQGSNSAIFIFASLFTVELILKGKNLLLRESRSNF